MNLDEIAEIADALRAEFASFETKKPKAYVSKVTRSGLVRIRFTEKMKVDLYGQTDEKGRELQQNQDKEEAHHKKFL